MLAADARPDLSLSFTEGPFGPYLPGEMTRIVISAYNVASAGAAAAPSTVALYFSDNPVLDAGDRLVASARARSLKVGKGAYVRFSRVRIPADLPAGRYYPLARIDDAGVVDEQSEDNNIAVRLAAFTVLAPVADIVPVAIQRVVAIHGYKGLGYYGRATLLVWNTGNAPFVGEVAINGYATDDGIININGGPLLITASPVSIRPGASRKIPFRFSGGPVDRGDFVLVMSADAPGDPTPGQTVSVMARFRRR